MVHRNFGGGINWRVGRLYATSSGEAVSEKYLLPDLCYGSRVKYKIFVTSSVDEASKKILPRATGWSPVNLHYQLRVEIQYKKKKLCR